MACSRPMNSKPESIRPSRPKAQLKNERDGPSIATPPRGTFPPMRLDTFDPRLLCSVAFNQSNGYIEVATGRHSDVVYANMRHGRLKITVNGIVDSTWRLRGVAGLR